MRIAARIVLIVTQWVLGFGAVICIAGIVQKYAGLDGYMLVIFGSLLRSRCIGACDFRSSENVLPANSLKRRTQPFALTTTCETRSVPNGHAPIGVEVPGRKLGRKNSATLPHRCA